jgi:single-strand DNA-binding protein
MSDYNHVGISGRLTRDAELKSIGDQSVLEFGLASNRKFKDKEKTTFVDVTLWGKMAEVLAPYLVKGKHVIVGGRLQFESWETDGSKRSKLTINADSVDMSPKGGGSEDVEVVERNTGLPTSEADVPF